MCKNRFANYLAAGICASIFFSSCGTPGPRSAPQILRVYATSAVTPWLPGVYDCASASIAVELTRPLASDIQLRLGPPAQWDTPAYQIGSDDVLVVVHPQIAVGSLTLEQVRELFSGQVTNWKDAGGTDLAVQVWTFSPREDVQAAIDQVVLHGQPVSSLARLAVSAQAMSDGVGVNPGSVGLLPRRWKAGNTREALVVASLPVLALVKSVPQGSLRDMISCLQSAK